MTIGEHSDYVKCVVAPNYDAPWVASGGLDRRIIMWDTSGHGEIMRQDFSQQAAAGVYAMATGGKTVAYGGTEKTVKLFDASSGAAITKLIGHTDIVRALLVSADGRTIVTAGADATVKKWSLAAGRCMFTVSTFDSIWSLWSDDPHLNTFYAGHRNGIVSRTDSAELDGYAEGSLDSVRAACRPVCHEASSVASLVGYGGDTLWTATNKSSINRWHDALPEPKFVADDDGSGRGPMAGGDEDRLLRTSTAQQSTKSGSDDHYHHAHHDLHRMASRDIASLRSGIISVPGMGKIITLSAVDAQNTPRDTIGGRHGLTHHITLNDRQRVLTMDTNGEAELWNIVTVSRAPEARELTSVPKNTELWQAVARRARGRAEHDGLGGGVVYGGYAHRVAHDHHGREQIPRCRGVCGRNGVCHEIRFPRRPAK